MKKASLLMLLGAPLASASDFDLKINAHLNLAFGASSGEEAAFATHAHDPNDEFTVQGLELNASATYGDYLSGFIAGNSFLDDENDADAELEEAFLKLSNLPLGTEIRAGRFLNRFGTQNSQHIHSWHFVDSDLITTRFLGDEGLISNSVEVSYRLPVEHDAMISFAFGDAIAHDDHGHGHDEEHEEHHDDDEDEDEDHHEEEHHIEGEGLLPMDDIFSVRLKGVYKQSDFKKFVYGASALWGENETGETTGVYSADLSYIWRENGTEAGGRSFRATIEPIYRDFDYADEDETGNGSEWGVHTHLGYGFNANWDADLRFDYIEGVGGEIEELDERSATALL